MPLAHITLATRDVTRSVAFFTEAFGWRPILRPGNIGRPAAWLEIGPGQELHLVEVAEYEPSPFEAAFGRHVAVTVHMGEMDGLRRRLASCGAEVIEAERPAPFPRFFFRTPDGYVFEVLPAERTPET